MANVKYIKHLLVMNNEVFYRKKNDGVGGDDIME